MTSRAAHLASLIFVLAFATACSDPPPTAIAARRSRLGSLIPNAEVTEETPADPETLFLLLGSGNAERTCADPFIRTLTKDIECLEEDVWRVTISVPPALAQPGKLQLSSPELKNSFLRVIVQDNGCLVEGDKFTAGALQILSVGKTEVSFHIDGAADPGVQMGDGVAALDVDGDYTATVCP